MAASTTMTIRVPAEVKHKLERLAADSKRSKSFLAGEAVAAYVERELEILQGIEEGLEDMVNGDLVSHEEAIATINGAIDTASPARVKPS